jgi:hypothetical protein
MPDSTVWMFFSLGTLICLLGFVKWPKSTFELLRPRFVVPACIWMATFSQVIVCATIDSDYDVYAMSRDQFGAIALRYICLCLLLFWAGYVLPLGKWAAKPLLAIQGTLPINGKLLYKIAVALVLGGVFLFFIFSGTSCLGIPGLEGGSFISATDSTASSVSTIIGACSMLGAALVGLSWPEKENRTWLGTLARLALIFLACTSGMCHFSRGSGLPALSAAAAFAVRFRRLSFGFIAALVWVALCAHAGLVGRGFYGHLGGLFPYLSFLVGTSIFGGRELISVFLGASDAYTSLCVAMNANTTTDCHLLTPINWLIFQIPLPRAFGFFPEWTVDYTYFLGGQGNWGYTVSMFGDSFGELGWAGCLVFLVWGVVFKAIDRLSFTSNVDPSDRSIQPYMMIAFISYLGLEMGLFNTNRSMVVALFFPIYAIVALMFLTRIFMGGSASAPQIHQPADAYS